MLTHITVMVALSAFLFVLAACDNEPPLGHTHADHRSHAYPSTHPNLRLNTNSHAYARNLSDRRDTPLHTTATQLTRRSL